MRAEQDEDQQERVGATKNSATSTAEADEPNPRRHRGHCPAAVERHDGDQVDQVQEEADIGQGPQQVAVERFGDPQAGGRAEPCRGPGPPAPRAPPPGRSRGICSIITAPRKGMNIGALALMPSRRSWITWPISWMKQQQDEAGGERPAPEQRVGRYRDERRAGRAEHLDLRQQQQAGLDGGEELRPQGEPGPPGRCRSARAGRGAPFRGRRRGRSPKGFSRAGTGGGGAADGPGPGCSKRELLLSIPPLSHHR